MLKCLVVKLGTTPTLIAARWSSQGQAYDHKQSTTERYPRISIYIYIYNHNNNNGKEKIKLFLLIKARTCGQANMHLSVFLVANHFKIRSRRTRAHTMLENMEATSIIHLDALWWWNTLKRRPWPAHLTFTQKSKCGEGRWKSHHKVILVKKIMSALPC
jgi:hypothetical protein